MRAEAQPASLVRPTYEKKNCLNADAMLEQKRKIIFETDVSWSRGAELFSHRLR